MRRIGPPLGTTVVGSHPQPDWLIDRDALLGRGPARVRAPELWRVAPERLAEAQDDATRLAIADMERAGIDIVSDGEMRRESYSNFFANALDGVDPDRIGTAPNRRGRPDQVPLVNGPIRRRGPVEVDDARFLRAHTDRLTKMTLPGPFTMSQQAQNEHYPDRRALALDYADAVVAEIVDLHAAGTDVVQLDEPYLQSFVDDARSYAVEVIARAVVGAPCPIVVHTCFGYAHYVHSKTTGYPFLTELAQTGADYLAIEAAQPSLDLSVLNGLGDTGIVLGVIDLEAPIESVETVVARIRAALEHVPADRLLLSPDCGMKYLPRSVANAKLGVLAAAAASVRSGLG